MECARHGAVVRVQMAVVPSAAPQQRAARVFVVFANAAAAASAVRSCSAAARAHRTASRRAAQAAALDGRLFAGRRVRCLPYDAARFAAGNWEAQL